MIELIKSNIISPCSLKIPSELSPLEGGLSIILTKSFRILVAIFFLCSIAIPSLAQSGGTAGAFSRIGFGPRGMAMGNALTSVTHEGIYSYYNPALAARAIKGNQVDLAVSAMSFDRSFNTVNGTFQLPPSAGISLSLINANVGDIDGRSIDGYDTGSLSTHEYQVASALGLQISPKLSLGIGLKYLIADYHSDISNASTLGIDLGALYKFSKHLQLGFAARDLLASYTWNSTSLYGDDSSARTDDFPTQFRLGASYYWDFDLLVSLEVGRMAHENFSSHNVRLGSAYKLHDLVTVRAGWQVDDLSSIDNSNQLSAGFSIYLPVDFLAPSVDYAFIQEQNNVSYMHTFGLRLEI